MSDIHEVSCKYLEKYSLRNDKPSSFVMETRGKNSSRLVEPACMKYRTQGSEHGYIFIHEGFVSDFASIPAAIGKSKCFPRRSSLWDGPAVKHDWSYSKWGVKVFKNSFGYRSSKDLIYSSISRKEADDSYYYDLLMEGCPKWKAWIHWIAVKVGGKRAYNPYKEPHISCPELFQRYVV